MEYEIILDDEQSYILNDILGGYRFVYNKTLGEIIESYYEENEIKVEDISKIIEENKFLENIDYSILVTSQKEAIIEFLSKTDINRNIDVDRIFDYKNTCKKYKFKGKNDSIKEYYFENIYGDFKIENERIHLPFIPSHIGMRIKQSYCNMEGDMAPNTVKIKQTEKGYSIQLLDEFIEISKDKSPQKLYEQNRYLYISDKLSTSVNIQGEIIGISRSLDDFATLSNGSRLVLDDSLKDTRKKYFREKIKLYNRIYGSLGSKKNIEDNQNFQNRKKNLEKIIERLQIKYREYVLKIADQISLIFDEVYIEDISLISKLSDETIKNTKFFIEPYIDAAMIKEEKKNQKNKRVKKNEKKDTIDDIYWRLFIICLREKLESQGKKIHIVNLKPIDLIEYNEFERYQKGKATGGKKGQIFNREQKIHKKMMSERRYKKFANPSRARRLIYMYNFK